MPQQTKMVHPSRDRDGEIELERQIYAVGTTKVLQAQKHEGKSWNPHLDSYREKRALKFSSEADLDAAIDLLWSDEDLYALPRAHVGENTIIVPAESVGLFRKKGLTFTDSKVAPATGRPSKEIGRLRRGTS